MIVYIPTPITSAEQAEALPDDAVFLLDGKGVASKGKFDPANSACRVWIAGGDGYHTTETILAEYRVIYLAPIEAEEETTRAEPFADGTIHVSPQYWRDEPSRRLVTPWEES